MAFGAIHLPKVFMIAGFLKAGRVMAVEAQLLASPDQKHLIISHMGIMTFCTESS